MEKKYVIALDQGTTSSRAIIFDREQNIVEMAQKEFTQHYPKPGWVEHDPMEIWSSQYGVLMEVLAKSGISPEEIAAIGITNQRETTVVWEKETGRPICNAIVWQCRRTAPLCQELLRDRELTAWIKERTGLLVDAYFSGTKLRWILDNVPGAQERARRGELLFGTVDSWLIWKLTGGMAHVTDYTNASRTMLYNIRDLCWDEHICEALGIPMEMLPAVCSSSEVYGTANIQGVEVPIAGCAGDQQAALFGQTCYEAGEAKNTYGTGCFLLMNTGDRMIQSRSGLVTTIGVGLPGRVDYCLEGSVFVGGAVVQWLRDELEAMERDTGIHLKELRVDGGASANNFLMQFQADILGCTIRRPMIRETTALGAAYLAGLATGVWKDLGDIRAQWTLDRLYQPEMAGEERERLLAGWKKAVERAGGWAEE